MKHKWESEVPANCQVCNRKLGKYFIDGQLPNHGGVWAIMCTSCHKTEGTNNFGIGKAQKYITKTKEGVDGFKE